MLIKHDDKKHRLLCCEYCERVIVEEVGAVSNYIETSFYVFDRDAILICNECKKTIKEISFYNKKNIT